MEILRPALLGSGALLARPKAVILATVEGDIHDIGKTLVGTVDGAPVTRAHGDAIGADRFGANALEALHETRRLLGL